MPKETPLFFRREPAFYALIQFDAPGFNKLPIAIVDIRVHN